MLVETVRSSRDIDRLFREGNRFAHPLVVALIAKTPPGRGPSGRVAFIAGKKMGNAVTRNRAKRVLREAVRRTGVQWPGYDVALIAREKTATSRPADIDAGIRAVTRQVSAR